MCAKVSIRALDHKLPTIGPHPNETTSPQPNQIILRIYWNSSGSGNVVGDEGIEVVDSRGGRVRTFPLPPKIGLGFIQGQWLQCQAVCACVCVSVCVRARRPKCVQRLKCRRC